MITINAVKKFAGKRCIVNIPYLSIEKDERVALIGANGSGKTTLLRIIAGTIEADEGKVTIDSPGIHPYYLPQISFGFALNVLNNLKTVLPKEMSKEEAIKSGAECMFIEKYPDIVTVYSIGDVSKELCGGPHVNNTSELGHFKIKKEEASSAGVRRIKAILEEK